MSEQRKITETTTEQEARALAEEAVEEQRQGNKEEAKFLADEAKAIDPKAAAEVLKNKP